MFAAQFEQKINSLNKNPNGVAGRTTLRENSGVEAERRGLLDDDEDTIEFEMRKNK